MMDLETPGIKSAKSASLREDLHRVLQAHCNDSVTSLRLDQFPGSQPVSLSRENFKELQDCVVCEKSDGVRYFLYVPQIKSQKREVVPATAFLVDRRYDFWEVKVLFPANVLNAGVSVFDGELVLDYEQEMRLLLYDTLLCGGLSYMHNAYLDRLNAALLSVIVPTRLQKLRALGCVPLFLKDFFEVSDLRYLSEVVLSKLPHKNDGLIFTCRSGPYAFYTTATIFKWKPDNLNTVDFALRLSPTGDIQVFTSSRDDFESYEATLFLNHEEKEALAKLIREREDTKPLIVECAYDWTQRMWTVHKVRTDKDKANNTGVVAKIWKSIQDRVSLEELIVHCEGLGDVPEKRVKLGQEG